MKKIILKSTLFLLLIFTFQVRAQQSEYSTKKINGIEYIVYTVQKSEGLYAISRRFEVTQAEINTLNPEIHEGLKVGQQILIPINDTFKNNFGQEKKITESKITESKTTESKKELKQDLFLHEVLKRQTLFAISRLYNVEQDEIIKLNPDIKNKHLKTGMVLQIPIQRRTIEADKKIDNIKKSINENTKYLIHIVKIGDTFYSLGNLYNVSIDEISKLNNITDGKLKIGSEIKIPSTKKIAKGTIKNTTDTLKSSNSSKLSDYKNMADQPKSNKKSLKIAFLLPFMLNSEKKDPSLERFQDFYAGALIAIEQAKSKGVSLEILTIDTEKTDERIISLLENDNLKKVDFIIGPAYSNQIPYISSFARKNKIHTLIPFSSKVNDVQTNRYLFQFNPGIEIQADFIKESLQNQYKNHEIVFINLQGVSFLDDGNEFNIALQNSLDIQNRKYKTINIKADNITDFNNELSRNKKNIVFFNTDKFSSVSPYLQLLDSVNVDNSIILFEHNGWSQNSMNQFSTISISPFKAIEHNEEFKTYNTSFNKYFDWRTSKQKPQFDILGYDLTSYFISMLYSFGGKFDVNPQTNLLPLSKGIQSDLKFFKQNSESGYKNSNLFLIYKKQHE